VDTTRAAVKLKQARQQLSQFIQDTGAYPFDSSARTSVAGFGRSEASKATWAARKEQQRVATERENAIMIERLRTAGELPKAAEIHLTPTPIDVDTLAFDSAHVNQEHERNITEEQAKSWIREAKISVTVWNGHFERYYGQNGAVYVNLHKHFIRTAYAKEDYDTNTKNLIEEMTQSGLFEKR
jgi:hypothetical protein